MNCRCTDNRKALALYVGRDAPDELPENLRRAVATCPTCREHYQSLNRAMDALSSAAASGVVRTEKTLWNELSQRLPQARPVARPRRNWREQVIPVFSMSAACLALLMVFIESPRTSSSLNKVYQTTSAKSPSAVYPIYPAYEPESVQFKSGSELLYEKQAPRFEPFPQNPSLTDPVFSELPQTEPTIDELMQEMLRLHQQYRSMNPLYQ